MDKLPPIDHSQDKDFQPHQESKEVSFPGCSHKTIQFDKERHELRCKCGVAFTGPRLNELYDVLTRNT